MTVTRTKSDALLIEQIRDYWNCRVHDIEITQHPVGSRPFFHELDAYRFEKLAYLKHVIDSSASSGQCLLEIGCGVGVDLAHFARNGSSVTGVDLSENAIELATKNFEQCQLPGDFMECSLGSNLRYCVFR